MVRGVKGFLVISFLVSILALTGQYVDWRLDSLQVTIAAREMEYSDLQKMYEEEISTDGYIIPEVEYLIFPAFVGERVFVTSQFHNRANPFSDNSGPSFEGKLHRGIDIVNLKQSLIQATIGGIVVEHFPPPNGYWNGDGAYGGKIVIEDSSGVQHVYAHLSETYVSSVPGRNIVEAGEIIGRMGRTGLTTGTHLHYEIRKPLGNSEYIWYDPAFYFNIVIDDNGRVRFPRNDLEVLHVLGKN